VDGIAQNFSNLLYADYFRLFHLQSYNPKKALTHPKWFSEQTFFPGIPHMHIILCTHNNPHITHLQPVQLSLRDIFYLRALLQALSARSFEDLRTVNGILYSSFQEALLQ
jgi:hypothetical protein